jgi:DNA-binding CsgD family transcriptional regulator
MTGSRPFNEEHQSILDALIPHLRRGLRLREQIDAQLHSAQLRLAALNELRYPLFMLDGNGRVIEMNDRAESFLHRSSLLRLTRSGGLTARCPRTEAKLRAVVRLAIDAVDRVEVAPPPPVPMEDDARERKWLLHATHFRLPGGRSGALLLLIAATGPDLVDIGPVAQTYDLTATEAEITGWLAAGRSIVEFSRQRQISEATVRWHLKNIYSKTSTKSMSELVATAHFHARPFASSYVHQSRATQIPEIPPNLGGDLTTTHRYVVGRRG